MNVESLELQLQGFRLVQTLVENDPSYFSNHNDIVRAFRWLWRSKGRFLRLQHEDAVPPRFHGESKMLVSFLMNYCKFSCNEDLDILFELIRIFLQPTSTQFSFVGQFLRVMVKCVLNHEQKKLVLQRFFSLGETTEETKVLSIQFLVLPMLSYYFSGEDCCSQGSEKLLLVDESVVRRFVTEILFPKNSVISCGDRLKVQLLQILNLFVQFVPEMVEPSCKEVIKFCWGLLKNEDVMCKGWASLVVSRCIVAFDTPACTKAKQLFLALLRSYQPEGKELVRESLDVLTPSLPQKLSEEEFHKVIDHATRMMMEDLNSANQLAHISHVIVRHPDVFFASRSRFAGYMLNSLSRLGLPQNSPVENRALAVAIIELLLKWEQQSSPNDPRLFPVGQIDSMANFLVRLRILMAEPTDSRAPRIEMGQLISRI